MRDPVVRIDGLKEFKRATRLVSPIFARELNADLKRAARPIADEASRNAPRRTGRYANSIRVYSNAKGVSIGSRLPQANVVHWGGTIRPRGVPIKFRRRAVIWDAAERQSARLVDAVGDAMERSARKAGW